MKRNLDPKQSRTAKAGATQRALSAAEFYLIASEGPEHRGRWHRRACITDRFLSFFKRFFFKIRKRPVVSGRFFWRDSVFTAPAGNPTKILWPLAAWLAADAADPRSDPRLPSRPTIRTATDLSKAVGATRRLRGGKWRTHIPLVSLGRRRRRRKRGWLRGI